MSNIDLTQAIGRLRRAQPRNPDTMAVCDALERMIVGKATKPAVEAKPPEWRLDAVKEGGQKFDKKAYQRALMRKRRAKQKEKT